MITLKTLTREAAIAQGHLTPEAPNSLTSVEVVEGADFVSGLVEFAQARVNAAVARDANQEDRAANLDQARQALNQAKGILVIAPSCPVVYRLRDRCDLVSLNLTKAL